ncbi:MAG: acyl-CoA dehydrogenase family protein [Chitinophagales bacterium]
MISLELTREQKKWVETARGVVKEEISPRALELDQKGDAEFDWAPVKALAECNLVCPTVPREYGGPGLGHLTTAIVMEEIAAGCAGVAAVVAANMHAAAPIILAGTEYQKETFLVPLVLPEPSVASFALTEPEAGSDVESINAFAQFENHKYRLTGRKDFVLNASVAKFISVFAATTHQQKRSSMRAFIVPNPSSGLVIGQNRRKAGIRYANTSELILDGVEIPERNVIGGDKAGSGYLLLTQAFDRGRALVGAIAVGIARAAYEMALDFARERIQFGKPIIEHQSVAFALADMATKIELARLITWKACWLIDQDQDYTTASSMAKLVTSQVAQEVTCQAADILGSRGYLANSLADKLVRDARVLSTIEGTNQIQRAIIASLL